MQIRISVIFSFILSSVCCDSNIRIDENVCGIARRSTGFMVQNSDLRRGEFPWIVALLYTKGDKPLFFCGGTLVTKNHVITAAHCIKPKHGESFIQEVHASEILALFGAYNLTNQHEPGRLSISPEEIHVHKDWNQHVERYDADIAILRFAVDGITFSRFIQPVCLSLDLPSVATEKEGIVAGWGRREDESKLHQPVPKFVKVPIHTNSNCFLETPFLASISSSRTFCAGLKNGRGICHGDSGSGFFVMSAGSAHLRGIVSSYRITTSPCDVTAYAVYTDVLKYKNWINEVIDESVSEENETSLDVPHNAPQFHRVPRKRDVAGAEWSEQDIFEWEREPTEAPRNFTLDQIVDGNSAMLTWEEVSPESIRGHFRGYKIQTWVEGDEDNIKEILVNVNTSKALVNKFTPDSVNFARILAFNDRFNGPPSYEIQFETPEGKPSTVQSLQAFPLGESAFLLQWKRPLLTNGKLQGYRIHYEEVAGTELGQHQERELRIFNPDLKQAKLAGLEANTKYRIHIAGFTRAGVGEDYYIEQMTSSLGVGSAVPDKPSFYIKYVPTDYGYGMAKVTWVPNTSGTPGSHFYTEYRKVGDPSWEKTPPETSLDTIEVGTLEPYTEYEFRVVSVKGSHETPSAAQRFDTSNGGFVVIQQGDDSDVPAGWFVEMILAGAFLILVLVIVICIKYNVHHRESANGRQD